ncbi:hydroxymethylglutaryl-CoA reductase, degradative [Lentilactobacillus raoultii]|uniref:3-hydroxy-3-methylglutaryl coenzyme A reductase n=1 Tax=Lentilactobacillus raoultii TaxID=1987503 RepID=A0ABW3PK90_9LACO|nr:hydroxymethylglutaryl-CoA reductase, degradative [Lentilactobacillus raoultii]
MASHWAHFYQKSYQERLKLVATFAGLTPEQLADLKTDNREIFDHLIENYLADYPLPEGVVTNLKINGQSYVVPLVTEEPSVIAAANNGSQLLASGEGILGKVDQRLLGGQVILKDVSNVQKLQRLIVNQQVKLLKIADQSHPQILKHGGGAKSLTLRSLNAHFWSVDLLVDPGEAMGANLINTMLEALADEFRSLGCQVTMAILSNAADQSLVQVVGKVPVSRLSRAKMAGQEVAQRISDASQVAQIDPYRAVTHNKGIMNGVDAVVMATGNDWRAVESAVHAFAVKDGQYRGLSTWQLKGEFLVGQMTLPLPIGVVGGATSVLSMAMVNKKIIGINHVSELMQVAAGIGLAQNLAALKALVTEGIQKGHMSLQMRSLAMANGATEAELPMVVKRLRKIDHPNSTTVAKILNELRK